MSEIERFILDFAGTHKEFTTSGIVAAIPKSMLSSRSTLEWYLSRMTKTGHLNRIGRGHYSSQVRMLFRLTEGETDKELFAQLKGWYPDAAFCVYKGSAFSSIQHHLSYNALTYVETQRELTETLFRRFQEEERRVFHNPDKKVFYDYVDISQPGLIVKPMVTGSPLQECDGVVVPTLEKILVDIRRDTDLDYMGGGEAFRVLGNALSLYSLNTTKLLRYAGRRHCREEFERDLKHLGL